MKILITGGAGYIGCAVAELIAKDPKVEKICIYDNFSSGNYFQILKIKMLFEEKITIINGDILDGRKLDSILSDYTTVLHLAAVTGTPFNEQNPHMYEQVNHWGTASLVGAIEDAKNVESLLYLSSASVYGLGNKNYSHESPPNPVNNYGKTKLKAEAQLSRLNGKVKVSTLRCGTVYGLTPSARFDSFINKFLFNALTNEKMMIYGDGNQIRPVIHILEVVKIVTNFLLKSNETAIMNVNQLNVSVNQVASGIKAIIPDSEYIHVNRDMDFRTLSIDKNTDLGNRNDEEILNQTLLYELERENWLPSKVNN